MDVGVVISMVYM